MNDPRQDDDLFDAAMRERYRLAAANVSAPVRARLRQSRREAASGLRRRGFSWPLLFGGAAAAVFAVAFGLSLRQDGLPGADPAPPAVAANYDEPASALDQDPDFYAWLGSSDAELVAVE